MSKVIDMGKVSTIGSLKLFIGKMSSSIILAFGTIVVTLLISEGDYGLYTIALVPATTFLLFQDWGIGTALTKFCASYRGKKEEHRLRSMVVAGMKFEVATALILTAFSLLFSGFIASSVFSKPETAGVMIILNLSIFFNAMLAAANSVFIGFERMGLLSICSICAAIAQSGLTVLLVYFGYGAMGAAVGYTFSSIVVGILAVALLYFAIFRKLSRDETSKFTTYQTLKPMFKYGLPLALSAVLVGVASQFSWFVLSSNVDLSSIGNLRVTQNFMVLLTFVAFPISTSLFPAFSKLDPKNEKPLIASVFAASVKYAVLFLIPATMVMMVLAKPIIGTIYGDKWALAPTFLTLGIINYLFTIFGSLSISSFLSAMEETKLILKLNVLTLLLIIPLCLLVIPAFGVIGAIFAGYAANSPNWIIGLYASRKKYGVKPNLGSSGRIFLSSAIAACFCYLSLNILSLDSWMQLIVGLAVFLLTYLLTLPVVQGIGLSDVNNLRVTFSGSGPVLKLLEVPLYLEEQILKRLVRIKKVDLLEETSAEQAM